MADNYFQNIQFIIHNNGFPLDDMEFEKMVEFAKYLNKDQSDQIDSLLKPEKLNFKRVPDLPKIHKSSMKPAVKVELIQNYMNKLEYNYTGTQFFSINSKRSMNGLMEEAKEMIRNSLPIKCLEAVVLGIYFTNGVNNLERFTLGFRSTFNGMVYRHVVLGVYSNGLYGALGMSRRAELMYKPLIYTSLTDLITTFTVAYENNCHKLKRISIGEIIPHNPCSLESINWKGIIIHPKKSDSTELRQIIEIYSQKLRKQANFRSLITPYSNGSCESILNHYSKYNSRTLSPKKNSTMIYFCRSKSSMSNNKPLRSQSMDPIRV